REYLFHIERTPGSRGTRGVVAALYCLRRQASGPSQRRSLRQFLTVKGDGTEIANALAIIKSIFDKSAFKRYLRGDGEDHNGKWLTRQFNKGLYDILMYAFAKTPKNMVYPHLDALREALLTLMTTDDSFINAID